MSPSRAVLALLEGLLRAAVGEICGVILALPDGTQRWVTVPNIGGEPDRFAVSRVAWRQVQMLARSLDAELAAFVHSHRESTELSPLDRAGLAGSAVPWIVVCRGRSGVVWTCYEQ